MNFSLQSVRIFIALGVCGAISLVAQSQTPDASVSLQQSPAAPVLTINTREVLLDIVAVDESGHFVSGLTGANFTITEEGQPQVIRHLEAHSAMNGADVAKLQSVPPLPPNTFSNFAPIPNTNALTVILLDALNTPVEAQMYLRQQVIHYLKDEMQPGTPIAIFQLDTEMRLVQSFSADPAVLLAAAESKRDMPSLNKPIYGSRDFNIRMHTEILHDGLNAIGRYLAGYPGRKNLIWFTGMLPTWLSGSPTVEEVERRAGNPFRDSMMVFDDSITGLTDALSLSRVAVYPVDARGLMTQPMFSAANRGPDRLSGFNTRQAFNQISLDQIGEATGGKAYYNTNGLKDVIAQVVNNGSNYYTLAYATTNQKWEGEFRHIKITVNRPGIKLQYRPGYYAIDRTKAEQRQVQAIERRKVKDEQKQAEATSAPPATADTAANANPDQAGAVVRQPKGGFEASMALGAVPPTEIVLSAGVFIEDPVIKLGKNDPLPKDNYLKDDFKTKPFRNFDLNIRADAHSLNIAQSPDGKRHGSMLFVTALYTPEGEMINSIETTVNFDVSDNTYRKLLREGLPVKQQIAVPVKGNYFLRVGVHDMNNDRVGAVEIPVDQVRAGIAPPVAGGAE